MLSTWTDSLQQESDLVTSRYWTILILWLSATISMLWETTISNWCRHWSHRSLLPCKYQSTSNHADSLDVFSTRQYHCVYSLVKTWIICAYAICDAWCVFDANQKGRLMAATTDMANTLFAMGRMGWCFALLWRIVGSKIYVRQCGLPYLGPIICIWGLLP